MTMVREILTWIVSAGVLYKAIENIAVKEDIIGGLLFCSLFALLVKRW